MIKHVTFERGGERRDGVLALRRVDDRWVPIMAVAHGTVEEAVVLCVADVCGLLDELVGVAMLATPATPGGGRVEREMRRLGMVQGLEVANEGLRRLWDEPGEEDRVELPEVVACTAWAEGGQDAGGETRWELTAMDAGDEGSGGADGDE